jgi:preprotein translocase subunit SecY
MELPCLSIQTLLLSLPNLSKTIISQNRDNFTISSGLGIGLLIFASLYGIVFLQEGVRIIPLISSKQLNQSSVQDSITSDNNYLPLRFNQAGVIPIILTTAILVIPNYHK